MPSGNLFCIYCGAKILNNANFCVKCGNKVKFKPANETNSVQQKNFDSQFKNNSNNKKSKKIVDINKATRVELTKNTTLSSDNINRIIILRNSGTFFKSYFHLQKELHLSTEEINKLKRETTLTQVKNSEKKNKNFKKTDLNKSTKMKEKKNKIVDINTATKEELLENTSLTLYNINKLISLKNAGTIFKSYTQLQKELHLTTVTINKLKNETTIKKDIVAKKENELKDAITPIDFNKATKNQLLKIQALNYDQINTIILLQKNGIKFNSFDDLKEKAEIDDKTINNLKKHVKIISEKTSEKNINSNKKNYSEEVNNITKEGNNKSEKTNNEKTSKNIKSNEKIDINKANQQTLTKIPSINIIKAKKILDLREQGYYIKSYEDLQQKLNLKPEQINQIKQTTTITKPEKRSNKGRRIMDI